MITLINPLRKLTEEYCFPAPMLQLVISSGFVETFLVFETFHEHFPAVRAKEVDQ